MCYTGAGAKGGVESIQILLFFVCILRRICDSVWPLNASLCTRVDILKLAMTCDSWSVLYGRTSIYLNVFSEILMV